MSWDKEHARISQAYHHLNERMQHEAHFFTYRDYAHVIRLHERYWVTLVMLRQQGISNLQALRILDVGCGDGIMLRQLIQWGACPNNLAGIDLRPGPIEEALRLNPTLDVRCGSAVDLPWPENNFDLVSQYTVFSSILDPVMKQKVASEMQRVLRPGGMILWYDFIYNNPSNSDVRGIPAKEIRELFPSMQIHLKRITLVPPIARRIPPTMLPVLYPLLASLPILRTHYLGLFVKK